MLTVSSLKSRNQTACTRCPSRSCRCRCRCRWGNRKHTRRLPGLVAPPPLLVPNPPDSLEYYTLTTTTTLTTMDGWSKLQSSLSNLNIGQSANKFAKGFNSSVQATRERFGNIAPDEITELPQGNGVCKNNVPAAHTFESLPQSTRTSRPASMRCVRPISRCSSEENRSNAQIQPHI